MSREIRRDGLDPDQEAYSGLEDKVEEDRRSKTATGWSWQAWSWPGGIFYKNKDRMSFISMEDETGHLSHCSSQRPTRPTMICLTITALCWWQVHWICVKRNPNFWRIRLPRSSPKCVVFLLLSRSCQKETPRSKRGGQKTAAAPRASKSIAAPEHENAFRPIVVIRIPAGAGEATWSPCARRQLFQVRHRAILL